MQSITSSPVAAGMDFTRGLKAIAAAWRATTALKDLMGRTDYQLALAGTDREMEIRAIGDTHFRGV